MGLGCIESAPHEQAETGVGDYRPSFTMCAFWIYCSERKSPNPRVESLKLHSVRLSPKRTNSGMLGLRGVLEESGPGLLDFCLDIGFGLSGNNAVQFDGIVLSSWMLLQGSNCSPECLARYGSGSALMHGTREPAKHRRHDLSLFLSKRCLRLLISMM
jgi:hypothetical protein